MQFQAKNALHAHLVGPHRHTHEGTTPTTWQTNYWTDSEACSPILLGGPHRAFGTIINLAAHVAEALHQRFRIAQISLRYRLCHECTLDTRIATFRCHTNSSMKLPSLRHFQDRFLTTNWEKRGKTGLCFARFFILTFCGLFASHNSNPYPNRSRIARCIAAKMVNNDQRKPHPANIGNVHDLCQPNTALLLPMHLWLLVSHLNAAITSLRVCGDDTASNARLPSRRCL